MAGGLETRSTGVKTLYLVRHAKSTWEYSSLADYDRPLNNRGLRDAPLMGQRLAEKKISVDQIWSSPARRAIDTAYILAEALNYSRKEIMLHDQFYISSTDNFISEIQSCPDEVKSLLIVGHNPVICQTANLLIADDNCGVDIELMPTCSIVAFVFNIGSWQQLRAHDGRCLFFDFPKKNDIFIEI
jgi:phosphohistidine phosphatase